MKNLVNVIFAHIQFCYAFSMKLPPNVSLFTEV